MKKKIILTLFLTFVLAFMTCYVVYAANDSFDTHFVVGTVSDSANPGQIAYKSITGTRYVFRINGEDIGGEDIGGKGSQNYFVNHVRKTITNSNGYIGNPSIDEEKKGANNEKNHELVYVGWNKDNTVVFSGNKQKYYFFDTPASSRKNYSGECNGEKQYRHVIVWRRMQDNISDKIHNDNFGLNGSDIKKLVDAIEIRAKKLGDQATLNQLSDIKAGKVDFEIRAEILMVLRMPTKYEKKLTGNTLTRKKSDCYAYYENGYVGYYTYREATWILNKIDSEIGDSNAAVHEHFGATASQLFEKDEPYKSEYNEEAITTRVKVQAYYGEYKKKNYYNGWDYISFENPYQEEITKITVVHKDENRDETLKTESYKIKKDENDLTFKQLAGTFGKNYTYIGVDETIDGAIEKSKDKDQDNQITIGYSGNKTYVITFWYRSDEATKIFVSHKSINGNVLQKLQEYTIEEGEKALTFTQLASAFGNGYEYVGFEKYKDETFEVSGDDVDLTIGYDGNKTYEIIFWYKMQTQVKIMGRCDGMTKPIYTIDVVTLDLPLNKTFQEKDYTPSKHYEFLNEYEVIEGTFAWTSKGNTKTGKSVSLDLDEATTTPQQILIVFYYESKYTLTVNHIYVDPITGDEEVKKTFSNSQIIPGKEKSLSSISMSNYLNLKYEPSSEVTADGFTKYSKSQNNVYTLKFTPSEENYTINFYYTSQTITVKHIQNNEVKKEETKVLDPNHGEEALNEYPFQKWVLNETEIGTETPKKVSIKEYFASQKLIFYYEDPKLIFGPGDPNKNTPVPDYDDLRKILKTGIIPYDLNNQKIDQKDEEYYWVLNENGGITVRFATTHLEKDSGSCSFVANIKIPFDVYVNSDLKSANTQFTITCDYTKSDKGYDIYEGTLGKIYIPIWVTEGDYTIEADVTQTYKDNVGKSKYTTSYASGDVKVVGAVYDFTITNLDGSDTTGDTMWKKALFGTAKEYKATETAVGQGTQQAKNYNYGIKRGTRFYFSLNTIGQKNKKIEIIPKFYYIDANGKKENVTMKSNYLTNTRSISLTDANRTTTEFKNERTKKTGKTNTTTFAIGDYTKITLDGNVNTPYLGITNEVKKDSSNTTLTNHANHWYGDYAVPNDAKFYKADGTLVSDENGVVVVYFEIKTIDDKNNYYLAYDGDSPFDQDRKISQWNYERGSVGNSMTMPKVSTADATTASDVWKINNSTATIIYSLRANATTKQNVTSIGTH